MQVAIFCINKCIMMNREAFQPIVFVFSEITKQFYDISDIYYYNLNIILLLFNHYIDNTS